MFKFNKWYDYLAILIILTKILYYILIGFQLYFIYNKKNIYLEQLIFYKNKVQYIFNVLLAILLIYLFNPYHTPQKIDSTINFVLFAYSITLFLSYFEINEDTIIKYIQLEISKL